MVFFETNFSKNTDFLSLEHSPDLLKTAIIKDNKHIEMENDKDYGILEN